MDTIANRIKLAMEQRDMKQSDLVRITGIGKSSISTYLTGAYEPKQKNIYKLAEALNVSEAWLMGNDVPMKRLSNASNELPKILNYYNKLNSIGKQEATKRVEELSHIPKYTEEITLMAAHNDHADDPEELEKIYEDIMNLKRPE